MRLNLCIDTIGGIWYDDMKTAAFSAELLGLHKSNAELYQYSETELTGEEILVSEFVCAAAMAGGLYGG